MRAIDLEAGLAQDVACVGYGSKNPAQIIVEISLEDDDEICFQFDEVCLVVPADRIRRLLGKK